MCSGQTVHRLEGQPPLTLRAGELLFSIRNAVHSVDEAGEGDVGVNFIVLPQFFEPRADAHRRGQRAGQVPLNSLKRGGSGIDHMHFLVSDVPPVQNLVENLVWSLVNPQPNARRIDQMTMALLLLQLLNHTRDMQDASGNAAVVSRAARGGRRTTAPRT